VAAGGADDLTPVGSSVYFTTNEIRLWRSDGTAAGTIPVSPYIEGQDPNSNNLTPVGNRLFFSWIGPGTGRELWISDGTPGGTRLVRDIYPGTHTEWVTLWGSTDRVKVEVTNASHPDNLTDFNGTLFYSATDATNGRELWKSDGTAAGTTIVKNI